MFEQLRRKRMAIEQSVSGRGNRDGMSSLQRRKLVEKDLLHCNHLLNQTAQDFRKRPHPEPPINHPNKTATEGLFWEKEEEGSVKDRQIAVSPSVKDISPQVHEPSALANEFYELSAEPNNNSQETIFSPHKNIANFYQPPPLPLPLPPVPFPVSPKAELNIHSLQQQSSRRESEPQIQDEEIKLPQVGNYSSRTQSNNNSDAIFFTSHFKEIMNNHDLNSPPKEPPPPILEIAENKVQSRGEQEPTGRFQAIGIILRNNPSGQSLAISNDSSLKYSLNESAIQDIITRKLSNELVVDSLSPSHQLISAIATALVQKENVKDVVELGRMYAVAVGVQRRMVKGVFVELAVNREIKSEARNRKIKAESFLEQRQASLLQGSFNGWRAISHSKQQGLLNLTAARQRHTLEKCFKTFKMLLFDRRIHHQIDMYYLSKVFQAFRSATEKDSRRSNQKAFRLYFKNLKKRMFDAFLEGCFNSRREVEVAETAISHYEYSLFRRCFDAWKRLAPREEKYVRLAVTTTNLMKETADHRLLHTRTFDFYEIR